MSALWSHFADPDVDATCCISGHFASLPPTPAPAGLPVAIRDASGNLLPDPELAQSGGGPKNMQRPWRAVVKLIGTYTTHNNRNAAHVYKLECGHRAVRKQRMTETGCGVCAAKGER